jgi:hypothetical protein
MIYDGIFFVNHALKVNQLSVYNEEERFNQTIETIDSINKYCPNNQVFIFDSSPERPNVEYFQELSDRGVIVFYTGDEPDVKRFSQLGQRSIAECITFLYFLNWFQKQDFKSKRIYKLSGRYRLNDNFIVDREDFKDAFVFATALDSWMPKHKQDSIGTHKLFRLRCWHMDYTLLDTFQLNLSKILQDCATHGIDVEHAYYKNLHTYKTIELDKIGVCGNIAPSGDYIDE